MISELQAALSASFDPYDPLGNIASIKAAVRQGLRAADPKVKIKDTEYFNHTYSPDMVLSWDEGERFVYLRTDSDPGLLAEDAALLSEKHPVLFSLSPIPPSKQAAADVRPSRRTLVLDANGVDALVQDRDLNSFVRLASGAMLRGGHGVFHGKRAQQLVLDVEAGFEAAQFLDQVPARHALDTFERTYDRKRSAQLSGLMYALWEGSGGSATQLTGEDGWWTGLDAETLRLLVSLADIPETGFWRRLGRRLTLELIESLENVDTDNLHRLIDASIRQLQGRACRLSTHEAYLNPAASAPRWVVSSGNLTLRGTEFDLAVAESVEGLRMRPTERGNIRIEELQERAQESNISIRRVDISTGLRNLRYGATRREDISSDEEVSDLAALMGPEVRVTTALISTGEDRQLECDFSTSTLATKTKARLDVTTLVRITLSLLARSSITEAPGVQPLIRRYALPSDDPTLF